MLWSAARLDMRDLGTGTLTVMFPQQGPGGRRLQFKKGETSRLRPC